MHRSILVGVLGGDGGPVVKRPPQTRPKQPAGGIEEAPCCTDWPDSSDSSGEDRLSAGRWEDLSSRSVPPPLSYISLQTHSLTSNLTPCLRCLFILLSVFCLASLPGPRRCLKSYTLHIRPRTWTAARISSTPLPWLWLLLLLFSSVIQ